MERRDGHARLGLDERAQHARRALDEAGPDLLDEPDAAGLARELLLGEGQHAVQPHDDEVVDDERPRLARPDAVLVARLSDASGINTVGAGVGHEILLTIDGDVSTAVDVGRYYTGDLDTYRSGTIRFPLPRLAPGAHTARLTAWDGVNNSTTAEVAFTISDAGGLEVTDVFPYPNPTAGPTRFTFAHNLPAGTPARIQLRIFTVAGRPIRTIDGDEALPGGVLPGGLVQIPWDGRDDDLDRLGSGVYLYRLRVEADGADGGAAQVVERVERLAIIR